MSSSPAPVSEPPSPSEDDEEGPDDTPGDSQDAVTAKKKKKKKKKPAKKPADKLVHVCRALPLLDVGRAVCRLPVAAWEMLKLPFFGAHVAVDLPGRVVFAVAQPWLEPHADNSPPAHVSIDADTVFVPHVALGAAAMQAHTLPPAIPLSAVRILPGSLPPGAHVLVYVPAHAPAAGKLLTAQLRRVLADRVIAPGAVVRVDADTTVQVLLVDGSAAAATLVYVTRQTEFVFTAAPNVPNAEAAAVSEPEMAFPGLEAEFASLVELIRLPLQHAAGFARLGISPPAGVLLHGPPGTGKTMLARTAAFKCNAKFMAVSAAELAGTYLGDTEARLREVFAEATAAAADQACVLFLDEIDTICPKREKGAAHENRVVAQLLTLMDGLASRGRLVVLAATNRPNAIDAALRRPGRFDREVGIAVPNAEQRAAILRFHTKKMPLGACCDLDAIAAQTVAYVGADLAAMTRSAAMHALRRHAAQSRKNKEAAVVTGADFQAAIAQTVPSTRRDGSVTVATPTHWDDIGGLASVKEELRQVVEWPLKYPETFARLNVQPPRGILLHGPPGCAKTTLVRAAATATAVTFFAISGAQIYSPYVGESERFIRETFKQARLAAPAILFLDEVDALVGKRAIGTSGGSSSGVQERVLATLLNEMDGIESCADVLIVAATNRPDMLDRAFLRPGRIDKMIFIPPPDLDGRLAILQVHARKLPLSADVDLAAIARATEAYTGADLQNLCREAALRALRQALAATTVTMAHFTAALAVAAPSLTAADRVDRTRPSHI